MHCLEERRRELAALLDVLAGADADAVERAHDAVEALPDPDRCADIDALLADVAPPPPELAATVAELRDHLAAAHAEANAGHHAAGLALAEDVEARSRAVAYRPLRAEALAELADRQIDASRFELGARTYADAYWEALAAGHDRLAFTTACRLVGVVGQTLARPDDAEPWLRHAEALFDRLGRPEALAADLELRRGQIAENRYDLAAAIAHYRRARDLTPPRTRLWVARTHTLANVHMSLGELDLARDIFEQLLAARREIYGADHPENFISFTDLGNVAVLRGDFDTAERYQRDALAILRAAFPPRHERLAYPLSALGDIAAQRGDLAGALAAFEEARAIWEHNLGPNHTRVAAMLERLASVELLRGDLGLAEQHAARALAVWGESQSPDAQGTVLARLTLAQIELDRRRHAAAREHLDLALPLAVSVFGEDHLLAAVTRAFRALAFAGLGDLSAAEREADTAVAAIERTHGRDSVWLAEVLIPRAEVRQAQKRLADARADLERTLDLIDPRNAPIQRARAEFLLARIRWDQRDGRAQARALAEAAARGFQAAGARHHHADVLRWLAAHPE